ncbi:MAG TPA: SpoVG family protein [Planctomycetota bacterium]|nr:SpoVG family protein [Planctomycetota bacterium]
MEITEIRIKLTSQRADKLRAFCSVTFDNALVIRDLKIIEGQRGVFVAMPSRKISDRCPRCSAKNHVRAKFCNECGHRLAPDRVEQAGAGRPKLYADIAHPINAAAREALEARILAAYREELEKSRLPGYRPVEIYEPSEDPD